MANEYLGECHALCFIENRKGISQIFPKIEELHPFWLKQVIWQNALLDLIRAMFMKMAVTQLIMGLSEKFFRLHDPQTPLYQENITILYLPKVPDRMVAYKSVKTALLLSDVIDADHQNSCLFTNKGHYEKYHAYPSPYYTGANLRNILPQETQEQRTKSGFKRALIKHVVLN